MSEPTLKQREPMERIIATRFPDELVAALERCAEREMMPAATVVRRAVVVALREAGYLR